MHYWPHSWIHKTTTWYCYFRSSGEVSLEASMANTLDYRFNWSKCEINEINILDFNFILYILCDIIIWCHNIATINSLKDMTKKGKIHSFNQEWKKTDQTLIKLYKLSLNIFRQRVSNTLSAKFMLSCERK